MGEDNDDKVCFLFNEAQWIQLLIFHTSSWVIYHAPAISTRYSSFQQMRVLTEMMKDGYAPEVCLDATKYHGLTDMNCSIAAIYPSLCSSYASLAHLTCRFPTQYFGHHLHGYASTMRRIFERTTFSQPRRLHFLLFGVRVLRLRLSFPYDLCPQRRHY